MLGHLTRIREHKTVKGDLFDESVYTTWQMNGTLRSREIRSQRA